MDTVATGQLQEARLAAAEQARRQRVEELAAQLPELEAAADRQQKQGEAGRNLAQAQANARRVLEEVTPAIQVARERYETAKAELLAALRDVQPVQEALRQAAGRLQSAAYGAAQATAAVQAGGEGDYWGVRRAVTDEGLRAVFIREWQAAGGGNTSLDIFTRPDGLDREAMQNAGVHIYNSQFGARHFVR